MRYLLILSIATTSSCFFRFGWNEKIYIAKLKTLKVNRTQWYDIVYWHRKLLHGADQHLFKQKLTQLRLVVVCTTQWMEPNGKATKKNAPQTLKKNEFTKNPFLFLSPYTKKRIYYHITVISLAPVFDVRVEMLIYRLLSLATFNHEMFHSYIFIFTAIEL